MDTSLVALEDHGDVALVRFTPRENLYTADSRAMVELWNAFDQLQIQRKRVALFHMPRDYLSAKLVDDFWQRAREAPIDHAPRGGRARPQMVAAADASMIRSLTFLRSISALTIAACEGEVDFDLLGLMLACKYRMCSADTTFVNRTLRRNVAPGSGTPWFLARLLGYAKAKRLYLDEVTLTADEALELGIVDRVSAAESLEQDGLALAQRFAGLDRAALGSMMRAMDLVELDLTTYLEQAGTGFEDLPT